MSDKKIEHALIDGLINEANSLLKETRNFVVFRESKDKKDYNLTQCLQQSYNYTRVSSRLVQAASCLLSMKALMIAEISPYNYYMFEANEESLSSDGENDNSLSEGLRRLLEKSRLFYLRVQRLDLTIRKSFNTGINVPTVMTEWYD